MARWKLISGHYLQVPGVEWTYSEVDRKTNRPKTTKFKVPLHLDPNSESDWNVVYRDNGGKVIDGEVVVCREGKGQPGDIEFTSDLTPDMLPLDDEAKELSAKLSGKWIRPKEGLPEEAFATSVLAHLESKQEDRGSEVKEMQKAVSTLTEQMSLLVGAMLAQQQPAARRA